MPRFQKGGVRWGIIGLVTIGTIINYLTRSTLSVAAPTLMTSLHMSEKNYGIITGVFQFGIMLQPVAGFLLDIVRLRLGFFLFALAWGLITMAHALAGSWPVLAWLRGLQGFVEGVAQPGGMKVVAEWFPARERGLAGGCHRPPLSPAPPALATLADEKLRPERCFRRRTAPAKSRRGAWPADRVWSAGRPVRDGRR